MTDFHSSSVDNVKEAGREKQQPQTADSSKVIHGKPMKMDKTTSMEEVVAKLNAPREHVTVEEFEETLPDGTIHITRKVTKRTIKHIEHQDIPEEVFEMGDPKLPASVSLDKLETFEKPPFPETVVEEVDEIMPSGDVQKRQVVKNRMVHRVKTRHESFDVEKGSSIEEYEIDEIIPGTESIFYADSPSESESEGDDDDDVQEQKVRTDLGVVQEIKEDGSVITKEIVETRTTKTRTILSRSGSMDKETTDTLVTEEFITPSPSPRSASPVDSKLD